MSRLVQKILWTNLNVHPIIVRKSSINQAILEHRVRYLKTDKSVHFLCTSVGIHGVETIEREQSCLAVKESVII